MRRHDVNVVGGDAAEGRVGKALSWGVAATRRWFVWAPWPRRVSVSTWERRMASRAFLLAPDQAAMVAGGRPTKSRAAATGSCMLVRAADPCCCSVVVVPVVCGVAKVLIHQRAVIEFTTSSTWFLVKTRPEVCSLMMPDRLRAPCPERELRGGF